MKRLVSLIRREFWENKGALRTTPLIIGGLYVVFLLMSIFTTAHFDNELYTFREAIRLLAEQPAELRAAHAEEVLLGEDFLQQGPRRLEVGQLRLVDVAEDRQLWSERYDRELEDIFAIQDEVTLAHRAIPEGIGQV